MPLSPAAEALVESFKLAVKTADADEIIQFALNQSHPIPTDTVIEVLNSSGLRFSPILACMARAELMAERYERRIDVRKQDDLALKYIKLLVACGADINLSGEASFPLLWASKRGWNRCVQYLLEQGADPNQSMTSLPGSSYGVAESTPLMAACASMQWETARLLMKNSKTNTHLRDTEGYTAFRLATKAVEDRARKKGILGAGDTISFAPELTLSKFLDERAPKPSEATYILGAGAGSTAQEDAISETSPVHAPTRQIDAVLQVLNYTCGLVPYVQLAPGDQVVDRILSFWDLKETLIIPKEARNEESLKLILDNILNTRYIRMKSFTDPVFIKILAQYTKLPTEPKYSRSCTDLIDKILDELSPRYYESYDQDPIPRLKDTLRQIKEPTVPVLDPTPAPVPIPVIAAEDEFVSIPARAPAAPVLASTPAAIPAPVPVAHVATARGFFGAEGKQQPKATKLSKQEQELFGKLMAYMVDRTADRREYFSVYKWFRGCDSRTIKLNAAQQLLTAISNQDPTLLNILGKLEKRALNDSRLGKIYAEYLLLQSNKQAPSARF